jgi:hypothetical protein
MKFFEKYELVNTKYGVVAIVEYFEDYKNYENDYINLNGRIVFVKEAQEFKAELKEHGHIGFLLKEKDN